MNLLNTTISLLKKWPKIETVFLIIGVILYQKIPNLENFISKEFSPQDFTKLTVKLLLVFFLFVTYFATKYFLTKPCLKRFHNVYKDRRNNIYCQSCKIMLSKHHISHKTTEENKSLYRYSKCKNEVYLTLTNGEHVTLQEFLKQGQL